MKEEQTYRGKVGEQVAESYLKKQGYRIVQKNFRAVCGEIDLIAYDKNILVFIEVKLRRSTEKGSPFSFISPSKQQKIRKTAAYYLMIHHLENTPCRFDAVGIVGDVVGDTLSVRSIELIKDAF